MRYGLKLSIIALAALLSVQVRATGAAAASAERYLFDHNRTSITWINAIFQDRDGFMWLGTEEGLYRDMNNTLAERRQFFSGMRVAAIQQDGDGIIWALCNDYYFTYDPLTCRTTDAAGSASRLGASGPVQALYIDTDKNVWWADAGRLWFRRHGTSERIAAGSLDETQVTTICSRERTVYVLMKNGRVVSYSYDAEGRVSEIGTLPPPEGADEGEFYSIFVDSRYDIWLSQGAYGAWVFIPSLGRYEHFSNESRGARHILEGFVCTFTEDADGNVWIATNHGGITVWNGLYRPLTYLESDPTDASTILSNSVYSLYRDRDDNIWVGYSKNGLSVWRGKNRVFTLSHLRSLLSLNINDDINATCEDKGGDMWFGTDGYGLVRLDGKSGIESRITASGDGLGADVVTSLKCDSKGRVWAGTFYGGMSRIDGGKVRTYSFDWGDSSSVASPNVWSIDEDSAGRIWIGTLGGGLQMYDEAADSFVTYDEANSSLSNNAIMQIDCASDGNIYIATSGGIDIFNPETGRSVSVTEFPDGQDTSTVVVSAVCYDPHGYVWICRNSNLEMYWPEKDTLMRFPDLDIESARSVTLSSDNSVWVVADNCLCRIRDDGANDDGTPKFKFQVFRFREYPGIHFNQRSTCFRSDGTLVAGCFNGYISVAPSICSSSGANRGPQIYFTGLSIGEERVEPGGKYNGRVILDKAPEATSSITLKYNEKRIYLDFSVLDYSFPFKDRLHYRIEGRGAPRGWVDVYPTTSRITLFNLSPGKFRLTLATVPDDGRKGGVARMQIVIRPPWYFSTLAWIIYSVVAAVAALVLYGVFKRRNDRKKKAMEEAMRQERRHYVDEMKMQFFTNVSHDFRTPLTLIITPVEEMLRKDPSKKNDIFVSTIYRNALRLRTMVNQLLDLRKLDVYGTTLKTAPCDLAGLLRDVCSQFRLLSEDMDVGLLLNMPNETFVISLDRDKISKVVTNLLSNAFKYTPAGGEINVTLGREAECVRVSVADCGQGVADAEKKQIFERFYRSDNAKSTGYGIGLHIAREFVQMHGGEISVSDNVPHGALFSFTLPAPGIETEIAAVDSSDVGDGAPSEETAAPSAEGRGSHLLLVDDNEDFRKFMRASLEDEYTVLEACNGREALSVLEKKPVDVTVCDVMMPVMDGIEFCRRAKADINTSHIPIILLTAKAMQDDEFEGLKSGADDYVTKPFNMSILRLRIRKFVEWKQRLHSIYDPTATPVPQESDGLSSIDRKFMKSLADAVTANLGNPEFSVTELSSMMNMHRTQLYKKMMFLTGKAPLEYIRDVRLKRAAELLRSGENYISDVAYMVGFNSPKVFSRHFHDAFGCSPSEFLRRK